MLMLGCSSASEQRQLMITIETSNANLGKPDELSKIYTTMLNQLQIEGAAPAELDALMQAITQ